MSLEERIQLQHEDIKKQTLRAIVLNQPFIYMMELSKAGARRYGVPAYESFPYGLDKSLDWYNEHKKHDYDLSTEFYALKQGTEHILRYVFTNKPKEEEE